MNATALRAEGDSTPASDGTERITKLFPKCRPRTMQKHERLPSNLECRNELNNITSLSSEDERCEEPQRVIVNSKGDPYKLRDSRIIEIAGGRELYSVSRAKVSRKQRHSVTTKHNARNKLPRTLASDCDVFADDVTHEVQINRLMNSEPKIMVSRHTSPTYVNGDRNPIDHTDLGIPKNSSPILDPHKANDISTKSSPIAVVADGEVMVFDDNEDWKVILNSVSVGMGIEADASDNEIDSVKRTLDDMRNGLSDILNSKSLDSDQSCEGGSLTSPSRDDGSGIWSGDEDRRVTRVIGELPIAEYEGSPKRYGLGTQLTNCHASRSPRPGFPKRVVTESRDASPPSSSAAFDYLYEFSETRKVLEEFFRGPAAVDHNDELNHPQDLEYDLRRQSQECVSENGIDGGSESEWPHVTDQLDSPQATHNHTNFLGLQQRSRSKYSVVSGSLVLSALSAGAAWSGAASPARAHPHAPAPPAGLDAELSLMLMENELSELKGLSECPRGVSVQLPVVEDGLSSGHVSDTDNNNQPDTLPIISLAMEGVVENGTGPEINALTDADLHSLDPLGQEQAAGLP